MAVQFNRAEQTITLGAAADVVNESMNIESIIINSTAGAAFLVEDNNGQTLVACTTGSGNLSPTFLINKRVTGIKATTLPNGSVIVHLKKA